MEDQLIKADLGLERNQTKKLQCITIYQSQITLALTAERFFKIKYYIELLVSIIDLPLYTLISKQHAPKLWLKMFYQLIYKENVLFAFSVPSDDMLNAGQLEAERKKLENRAKAKKLLKEMIWHLILVLLCVGISFGGAGQAGHHLHDGIQDMFVHKFSKVKNPFLTIC